MTLAGGRQHSGPFGGIPRSRQAYDGEVGTRAGVVRGILALGAAVLLAAPAAQAAGATGSEDFTARVTVTVSLGPDVPKTRTVLECPGPRARACRALHASPQALWPDPDRVCTEIYGGPQWARIRGVVDGRSVDVIVNRANGCGIDDWESLRGVVPRV